MSDAEWHVYLDVLLTGGPEDAEIMRDLETYFLERDIPLAPGVRHVHGGLRVVGADMTLPAATPGTAFDAVVRLISSACATLSIPIDTTVIIDSTVSPTDISVEEF
jgi:hypothetical protein